MGTGNSLAMLPWFVRDYIAATRHLSLAERGAYTDLLFLSWEQGSLPNDALRLARMVGCGEQEFAQVWPAIREKFTEQEGGGLVNIRMEEHRAKSLRLSAERAIAGSAGGKQSAKQKASKSQAIASNLLEANGQAKTNPPSPSPDPSPIPDPSPDPSSPTETHPTMLTAGTRAAYETKEFHLEVIALYHEILHELPRVRVADWDDDRPRALNARIRERLTKKKGADTLQYWRNLFAIVATNDHWCGRKEGATWRANLDWLIKKSNFRKVLAWEPPRRGTAANGSGAHAR